MATQSTCSGVFLCCRAVLPPMLRAGPGTIINIAGGGFGSPHPGASAYASSKAGLMRLTDTLAAELAGRAGLPKSTGAAAPYRQDLGGRSAYHGLPARLQG